MHRVRTLLLGLILAFPGVARADYIDHIGGHGPLSCSTALKNYNQVEMWGVGPGAKCEHWTGDVGPDGPSSLLVPSAGMVWALASPKGTSAYACMAVHNGNYGWCTDARVISNTDWTNLGATPIYIQVSAAPACPTDQASSFTVLQWAPGAYFDWTPMDTAQLPTAIVGDGHTAPGLPYGNPLKVSDADVCVANLANYPALHATGVVAAVYTF